MKRRIRMSSSTNNSDYILLEYMIIIMIMIIDKDLEINKWKRFVIKVMSSETTTNNNQCQQCSKSFDSEEELI